MENVGSDVSCSRAHSRTRWISSSLPHNHLTFTCDPPSKKVIASPGFRGYGQCVSWVSLVIVVADPARIGRTVILEGLVRSPLIS